MSEEGGKIDEIYKLVRKNNKMVKGMYDAQKRAQMFRLIYWIVIVVLAVMAYLYIEPYIEQTEELYTSAREVFEKMQDVLEKLPSSD